MKTLSHVDSGGFSTYIIPSNRTIHSYSTHREDAQSAASAHGRSAASVSASTFTPTRRHTPYPPTDIVVATLGSGGQFLNDTACRSSEIRLQAASSSNQRSRRHSVNNVPKGQKHGTHLKHHDNTLDQSSRPHNALLAPSNIQVLPIRGRSTGSKQAAEPASKKIEPEVKLQGKTDLQSTPSSRHSETSELSYVVHRIILQHNRDCQKSHDHDHDHDTRSLTELLRVLAFPHALPDKESPPTTVPLSTVPPCRLQELGTHSTPSHTTISDYPSNAANTSKSSKRSKGKQPARVPESDSDSDQDGDDDRGDRGWQNPGILFGELKNPTLRCPFVMSVRYCRLKECERCLVANLPDMDKLVQHLRRTHGYCVRCARTFPNERMFKLHKSEENQCSGCHKIFADVQDSNKHKQESETCSKRDPRSEAERYRAIWESIVPEEPCPVDYRVDHASQFRDYSQVIGDLRRVPPDCIHDLLLQLRLVLEQGANVNRTDLRTRLDLISRCLNIDPAVTLPQNYAMDTSQSAAEHQAAPCNDLDDEPASSQKREVDYQHDLHALESCLDAEDALEKNLWPPVGQVSTSEYDFPNHLPHSPLHDTPLPSDPYASSSFSPNMMQNQLGGFGAQMQFTPPPFANSAQGQPPLYHPQQPPPSAYGQSWTMSGLPPQSLQPPQHNVSIPMWSPTAHPNPHVLFGEVPSQRAFRNAGQFYILRNNDDASCDVAQGANYSYAAGQQYSRYVDGSLHGSEQDQTPRIYQTPLNVHMTPLPPNPDLYSTQDTLGNSVDFPANSIPGPWINDATRAPSHPALAGQQQRPQPQSRRPSKRRHRDYNH